MDRDRGACRGRALRHRRVQPAGAARNLVREGWSGIDVQLRRRSDLIPNLVETVKGYAAHERALFEEIAAKRTSAMRGRCRRQGRRRAASCKARSAGCSRSPRPIRSSRPTRISSTLQKQLAELEDQLQMARRYYNGTVRDFNIAIQSFPGCADRAAARLPRGAFFQADDARRRSRRRSRFRGEP